MEISYTFRNVELYRTLKASYQVLSEHGNQLHIRNVELNRTLKASYQSTIRAWKSVTHSAM